MLLVCYCFGEEVLGGQSAIINIKFALFLQQNLQIMFYITVIGATFLHMLQKKKINPKLQ